LQGDVFAGRANGLIAGTAFLTMRQTHNLPIGQPIGQEQLPFRTQKSLNKMIVIKKHLTKTNALIIKNYEKCFLRLHKQFSDWRHE
jgi:hypothetical protein